MTTAETPRQTTSSAVARTLRKRGIATVPSRFREGVYVTGGNPNKLGPVTISVQIDGDQRLADDIATGITEVLTEVGLAFTPHTDDEGYHSFTVTGYAPGKDQ